MTPVVLQRGVGSVGAIGASNHSIGQRHIIECVLGANRERLSSRFWIVLQASIARISTNGSANVPPKFSHSPSGRVRRRLLPGIFRNGLQILVSSSDGRPRSHDSFPRRGFTPGGRCPHRLSRSLTRRSSETSPRITAFQNALFECNLCVYHTIAITQANKIYMER